MPDEKKPAPEELDPPQAEGQEAVPGQEQPEGQGMGTAVPGPADVAPGLAIEPLTKRIMPALAILTELMKKVRKNAEMRGQEQTVKENLKYQKQNAEVQLPINEFFYVSYDGDNIGNRVAQAEEKDDEEALQDVSARIQGGQGVAQSWCQLYGGKIIEAGGDEGLLKVPSQAMNHVEELRDQYKNVVGATLTVGIGQKISESTKARELGKLRGKNQVVEFDENTETELKLRLEQSGEQTEQKKFQAAGLGKNPSSVHPVGGATPDQSEPESDDEASKSPDGPSRKGSPSNSSHRDDVGDDNSEPSSPNKKPDEEKEDDSEDEEEKTSDEDGDDSERDEQEKQLREVVAKLSEKGLDQKEILAKLKENDIEGEEVDAIVDSVLNGDDEDGQKINGKSVTVHERDERGGGDDGYDEFGNPQEGKSQVKKSEEPLFKGKKDLMNMYGSGVTPEQKSHVEWAHSKMPNENWSLWATRAHRADPKQFTPETKTKVEHFAGSQHLPEVAKVRFDKTHDLGSGLKMLEDAEGEYNKRIGSNINTVKPDHQTKKIMDVGNNMGWYSLGRGKCTAEGKAMGHCGNAPSEKPGDRILSLRTEHKDSKGNVLHEPHATFIANSGYLGEMKGKGNTKPAKKYHKAIADLLLHPKIKGVVGGGYLHHQNFSINDLDPEQKARVVNSRSNLNVYEGDKTPADLPEKFKKEVEPIMDWKNRIKEKSGQDADQPDLFEKPTDWRKSAMNEIAEGKAPSMAVNAISNPTDDELHSIITGKGSSNEDKVQAAMIGKDSKRLHGALAHSSPGSISYLNNPNMEAIIGSKNPDAIENLASNGSLSEKDIDSMVNHPEFHQFNSGAHSNLLGQDKLDPKHHEKFINSPHESIRRILASRENLDPKYHDQLAEDKSNIVRNSLAYSQKLSPELQQKLLSSGHQVHLAENPNLHPKVGEQIARYAAGKNSGLNRIDEIRIGLLQNPNLSGDAIRTLASGHKMGVRMPLVYGHDNLPKDLFDKLASKHSKDPEDFKDFHADILKNRHLTKEQFKSIKSKYGGDKRYENEFKGHPFYEAKDSEINPLANYKMIENHLNKIKANDPQKYAAVQDRLIDQAINQKNTKGASTLMGIGVLDDEHHAKLHDAIGDLINGEYKGESSEHWSRFDTSDHNEMMKEHLEDTSLPKGHHEEFLKRLKFNGESPSDIADGVFEKEKENGSFDDEISERVDEIRHENYPFKDYLDDINRGHRGHSLDFHIENSGRPRGEGQRLEGLHDLAHERAIQKLKDAGADTDGPGFDHENDTDYDKALGDSKDEVHEDLMSALNDYGSMSKFSPELRGKIENYRDDLSERYQESSSDDNGNSYGAAEDEIKNKMSTDPSYWPKHLRETDWVKNNIKPEKPDEEKPDEEKPDEGIDDFGFPIIDKDEKK